VDLLIFGNGRLGGAIANAVIARGDPAPRIVGRPEPGGHRSDDLRPVDLVVDASRGDAIYPNTAAAIDAGARRFVLATTGWSTDADEVATLLARHGASAVVAPNLSVGAALFGRLVERATALFGPFEEVDPYVLEWHRRSKADRPSGTARDLVRRILATHPRKRRLADPGADGPPADDELELAVLRAGASPGMHLVGFDAPGETIELRLTARDRSAYAAGALLAADWLLAEPREPGVHSFDRVVDDRLAGIVAARADPTEIGRPAVLPALAVR
jgi:4-hydroxy-tetrahydrodipicolinate reductase